MTAPAPLATPRPPAPRQPDSSVLALAETALAALTMAAVIGLARLFADGSFLLPVLSFATVAHVLAAWCRRRGLGPLGTAAAATAGLVITTTWLLLPHTAAWGLPTSATLAEGLDRLAAAMVTFREVVAPAPVEPGFVLAAAVGVWVIAFVADTAAFRAGAVVEAAVPATTLFVFGAALGAPRQRALTTAVFLVALLGYWLARRALTTASSPTWLALDSAAGSRSVLRSGTVIGAAVVVAALVAGPLLPGAEADGLIPWRASDRAGDGARVTISPLVDIRTRIVDQASSIVFTVDSPARSYWRLTSLETFDGRIWSSNRRYSSADGDLEPGADLDPVASERITQEFEIGTLASIWLPAAYRPVTVEGTDASYDAESGSLIVPEDLELTQVGQRYTIESVLPELTGEALGEVPATAPAEISETYTALPEGFSPLVREEAVRVAGGATTPYAQALALQQHFRGGSFTYDLDVQQGHSGDALEAFLFQTRTGYCEQFAGAFAAMARAIGLPARVAVGFTPGDPGPDGRFVVRGANGHAWPEVYIEGYGWVAFEPTPGRGIPGGSGYTGVDEEQAAVDDPSTATTAPVTEDVSPLIPPQGVPTDIPPVGLEGMFPGETAVQASSPWPRRLLVAGLALVGLPAAWAALVGAATRARRWRRRRGAATPEARVAVTWAEVGEALAAAGTPPQPWEAPDEVVARSDGTPGLDPHALRRLAATVTIAAYAPDGIDDAELADATAAGRVVRRGLRQAQGWRTRVRAAVDPRPLLPTTAGLRRIRAGGPDAPAVLHRPR